MNWYLKVLKQYADFNGRARRTEFWMYVLFNFIITIVLGSIDRLIGTVTLTGFGLFSGFYGLAVLIPSLAVSVRRLHDIGKSGWMLLLLLIPIIGGIWLIVLCIIDGNPGENEYGINPKEITIEN